MASGSWQKASLRLWLEHQAGTLRHRANSLFKSVARCISMCIFLETSVAILDSGSV